MLKHYLELIRITHWIKNLLIFAPLAFSLQFSYKNLIESLLAFFAFSFIAGSIYIINDLLDVQLDRKHPKKKSRPLASGKIKPETALIIFLFLFSTGLYISLKIPNNFFYIVIAYFILNLLYSKWLKKIPIIDVMIIAIGFVLRIIAGAAAISVIVSPWITLCTFFGALFIGFGKRKSEINNSRETSHSCRNVLMSYEHNFINQLIGLTSGITIMSYALYTIDETTANHFKTRNLIYTIPLVVFGVFRYFQIIYTKSEGEDPTGIFLTDPPIFFNLIIWACSFGLIIYSSLYGF